MDKRYLELRVKDLESDMEELKEDFKKSAQIIEMMWQQIEELRDKNG